MFRWLLLAAVLAVGRTEDLEPMESHPALQYHELGAEPTDKLPGTGVYREIRPSEHPLSKKRIEEQNRIVFDRYSPTYAQPTWFLDYRYLKSGGREYVRGDGGQILILPKGVHAKDHGYKQWGDYDELLEFLRLQELQEKEKRAKERKHGLQHNDEEENERYYKADEDDITEWREASRKESGRREYSRKEPVGWEREVANERIWQNGDDRWSKH